ncbi:MAG: endonuclease domain-containing protein [Ruminococcus sp.]|nr:endonuclease domain-containing protein [Ruminococcus sp.]
MNRTKNSKLTGNAQKLRKNMTKEERHLWYDFLKLLPVTVNRQKTIGNCIVDFYCACDKLVIELDGSHHYTELGLSSDKERDEYLKSLGLTVVRYTNLDIKRNFRGVCEDILQHMPTSSERLTSPTFPSRGRP